MNDIEIALLESFHDIKPDLRTWGKYVDDTLLHILKDPFIINNKLKIYPTYRLKEDKSFLSKAFYRSKDYRKPLKLIEDKVGTRIVLLTTDDVESTSKVILAFSGWSSKVTKDVKSQIEEKPELFTYQSIHIVVCPIPSDSRFLEERKELLTCEIQIRTLLQHAYSEISHDSTYKGPFQSDKDIMRSLAKSMALMEATDDYFCHIFTMMSDEKRKYAAYIEGLVVLYNKFSQTFKRKDLDYELTRIGFKLFDKKEILLSDIQSFVEKYKNELDKVLHNPKDYLFEQPISILLSYYFFNHNTWLKKEWPLTTRSFKVLYAAYNTSND